MTIRPMPATPEQGLSETEDAKGALTEQPDSADSATVSVEQKSPSNHRIDSDFSVGLHLSRNAGKSRYELQFDNNPKTSLSPEVFAQIEHALKTPRDLGNGHTARFHWKADDKCWAIQYFDDSKAQCQQFAKDAFRDISDLLREHQGIDRSLIR